MDTEQLIKIALCVLCLSTLLAIIGYTVIDNNDMLKEAAITKNEPCLAIEV